MARAFDYENILLMCIFFWTMIFLNTYWKWRVHFDYENIFIDVSLKKVVQCATYI